MTISAFAHQHEYAGSHASPARRLYRKQKRNEAYARQAAFDAEVGKVAREQNCELQTARDVVRARRRFEHRRAVRGVS